MKEIIKKVPTKYLIVIFIIIIAIVTLFTSLYFIKKNNNVETNSPEISQEIPVDETDNTDDEEPLTIEVSADEEDINNLPEENSKVDETNKNQTKPTQNTPQYYIKVNYTANVVTIYTKDSNGEYTVPFKAMVCSTGISTPKSGVYKMSTKYRWLLLEGNVYGQYSFRITGHILFHSVPYLQKSADSLEYWEYDKLGTSASAGCIRLTVIDAKWIYDNCSSGTYVEFYSSSDPDPLGKPTSQKISSNEQCRNWDPTDPANENPWKSYVPDLGGQTNPEEQNKPDEIKPEQPNNPDETNPEENNPQEQTKPEENLPDINENNSNEQDKIEDSNNNENKENSNIVI